MFSGRGPISHLFPTWIPRCPGIIYQIVYFLLPGICDTCSVINTEAYFWISTPWSVYPSLSEWLTFKWTPISIYFIPFLLSHLNFSWKIKSPLVAHIHFRFSILGYGLSPTFRYHLCWGNPHQVNIIITDWIQKTSLWFWALKLTPIVIKPHQIWVK